MSEPLVQDGQSPTAPEAALNPAALTVEELARLLTAVGQRRVPPELVQADVDAGAPAAVDAQGAMRINLVHYAAWLLREVQRS